MRDTIILVALVTVAVAVNARAQAVFVDPVRGPGQPRDAATKLAAPDQAVQQLVLQPKITPDLAALAPSVYRPMAMRVSGQGAVNIGSN
jgi:hypothetical protein